MYTKKIQRKVDCNSPSFKKTFQLDYLHNGVIVLQVLGLQASDKAAMLMVITMKYFLCRGERDAAYVLGLFWFVLDHQHGCRDVTCKPAIQECFRVLILIQKINMD